MTYQNNFTTVKSLVAVKHVIQACSAVQKTLSSAGDKCLCRLISRHDERSFQRSDSGLMMCYSCSQTFGCPYKLSDSWLLTDTRYRVQQVATQLTQTQLWLMTDILAVWKFEWILVTVKFHEAGEPRPEHSSFGRGACTATQARQISTH